MLNVKTSVLSDYAEMYKKGHKMKLTKKCILR